MKPRYIQVNCIEGKEIDLSQAKAVLKYKPDIIFLEYPTNKKTPDTIFNRYSPENKPIEKLPNKFSKKTLWLCPWVRSDIVMWNNIARLWEKEKHQVLVYYVDAPEELVNKWFIVWKNMYPSALKNWLWWVQIYLREYHMAKNIRLALSKYKSKNNLTVLVFLQSFHWEHVKFLLKNPSSKQIWDYYFGKFKGLKPSIITETLQKENKVFYKYWKMISNFKN
jgi:hypothetical protein